MVPRNSPTTAPEEVAQAQPSLIESGYRGMHPHMFWLPNILSFFLPDNTCHFARRSVNSTAAHHCFRFVDAGADESFANEAWATLFLLAHPLDRLLLPISRVISSFANLFALSHRTFKRFVFAGGGSEQYRFLLWMSAISRRRRRDRHCVSSNAAYPNLIASWR